MKAACILQGDIRDNFIIVLKEMQRHFDVIILSTWKGEEDKIPDGDFIVLLNEVTKLEGFSHRNYQRYSTAQGIEKAKEMGCEYVLKWRTDMLPTRLNITDLTNWANAKKPREFKSRIVTCAFRNLSVEEDWFSTIPDYFAFGHIEIMELLWGDNGIDYNKNMNMPVSMIDRYDAHWQGGDNASTIYSPEAELYANFKDRLQSKLNIKLSHETIVKGYMRVIDHNRLGVVWFSSGGGYRSISQAWEYPWWSEKIWLGKEKVVYISKEYRIKSFQQRVLRLLSPLLVKVNIFKQKLLFREYRRS
jgi:hypothetical protein